MYQFGRRQSWWQPSAPVYRKCHQPSIPHPVPRAYHAHEKLTNSIIAAAVLRLHFLKTQIHSPNPSLDGVNVVVWTEIQLQYSVIACVCYLLKPFMSAVNTTFGSAAINVDVYERVNGPSTKGYSFGSQLRSLRSKGDGSVADPASARTPDGGLENGPVANPASAQTPNGGLESATRGRDEGEKNTIRQTPSAFNQTTAVHEPRVWRDGDSQGSNGSTRMIIKKEVDFSVEIGEAR